MRSAVWENPHGRCQDRAAAAEDAVQPIVAADGVEMEEVVDELAANRPDAGTSGRLVRVPGLSHCALCAPEAVRNLPAVCIHSVWPE